MEAIPEQNRTLLAQDTRDHYGKKHPQFKHTAYCKPLHSVLPHLRVPANLWPILSEWSDQITQKISSRKL